jgi:hypothetical protein
MDWSGSMTRANARNDRPLRLSCGYGGTPSMPSATVDRAEDEALDLRIACGDRLSVRVGFSKPDRRRSPVDFSMDFC